MRGRRRVYTLTMVYTSPKELVFYRRRLETAKQEAKRTWRACAKRLGWNAPERKNQQ